MNPTRGLETLSVCPWFHSLFESFDSAPSEMSFVRIDFADWIGRRGSI